MGSNLLHLSGLNVALPVVYLVWYGCGQAVTGGTHSF